MIRKAEINGNSKVRVNFKVRPQDATDEFKRNLVTLFSRKYGVSPSQVDIAFEYYTEKADEGSISTENIKDIQDPRFQQELIKKYIRVNGLEDCDVDEVLKIDSMINSTVDFSQYSKKSTYDINYVRFKNFLSYGDWNYVNFSKFHGLVLLRGNPANQSGKTTLCNDLIHFLLYGKIRSGKADSMDQIFNKFRPEENQVVVEGSITVNGMEYIIRRTLTRPEKGKKTKQIKNEVNFYRVLEGGVREEIMDNSDNLQEDSTVHTNKALTDAICREEDFNLMTDINAANMNEIIYMKNAERSKAMTRWYGLESIEVKNRNAKEMFNRTIMVGRKSDVYNREGLKDEIESLSGGIEDNGRKILDNERLIRESDERSGEYSKMLNTLRMSIQKIDDSLMSVDYHTLLKEMKDMEDDGGSMGQYVKELKEKLDGYGEISYSEDEYKALNKEDKALIGKIASIRSQIISIRDEIRHLRENEYCPVCKKKLDNVDNSAIIAGKEKDLEDLTAEGMALNARKEEVEEVMKSMEESRKLSMEKSKLMVLLAKKEAELEAKRNRYREARRLKKEIDSNMNAIESNGRIQADINVYEAKVNTENGIRIRLSNENSSLSTESEMKQQSILEKRGIISQIEKEQEIEKNWKVYLQAIGKDGISKMILKETIPQMNVQIRNILEASDIQFGVEVQMNEKSEIRFVIKKGNVEADLSSGSGYEQFVSALTIRAVINQFSAIPKPPFLILDEIMGSVSSENLPRARKLIETISHMYKFILHVTHLEEVVDWHDKVIMVEKKDNVSHINVE